MIDFSDRLVTLRKSNAITQKNLAIGTGISEIGIRSYEARRRQPTADKLIALADFFNVSIDYLLGRSDNPARLQ